MSENVLEKLKEAKARASSVTGAADRPRPQAAKLSDDGTVKVGVFGPLGSGKTKFLEGPLYCGERVLAISTDFGGNGLLTLTNGFRKAGREDLCGNLMNVDLSEYEHVIEFLEKPDLYVPGLDEFDPTVFAWDGFSTFNIDLLDEYSEKFPDKVEGLKRDKWGHWADVKRATMRSMRKFFGFRLPNGKKLHKIMTFVEAKADNNELTNVTEKAPMIQGGAKDLSTGGFDVVLNCYSEEKDGELKFFYRCQGASGKYAVKNRDFPLKAVEAADPTAVWKVLTGRP